MTVNGVGENTKGGAGVEQDKELSLETSGRQFPMKI